jgi:lysophospholipase L1-like esterase
MNKTTILLSLLLFAACRKDDLISEQPSSINGEVQQSNFQLVQQNPNTPYYDEIVRDKTLGAFSDASAIAKNGGAIVLLGNSLFNNWMYYNWASVFPDHPVLNRAFGGSKWRSMLNWIPDLITCYKPKEVMLYWGENEISTGETKEKVISDFKKVIDAIRLAHPELRITVLALQVCPARRNRKADIDWINEQYGLYLSNKPNTGILDIARHTNGHDEYFRPDGIHLQTAGYQVWKRVITEYLNNKPQDPTPPPPPPTNRRVVEIGDIKLGDVPLGYGEMRSTLNIDSIIRLNPIRVVIQGGEKDIVLKRNLVAIQDDFIYVASRLMDAIPDLQLTFMYTKPTPATSAVVYPSGTTGWQTTEYFNRNIGNWGLAKYGSRFKSVNIYSPLLLWNPKRLNYSYFDGENLNQSGYNVIKTLTTP